MQLRGLRQIANRGTRRLSRSGDRCELCSIPLGESHRHVVDLERRVLCCSCRPCSLLFETAASRAARYRTVPDRICVDPAGPLGEEAWDSLSIPVGLAFLFFNSGLSRWVAFYPSPAGAAESELALEAMEELARENHLIRSIEPDVEALLVRCTRTGGPVDTYLVPIDACYDLVALVRMDWKGFDGGDVVREKLDAFFTDLRQASRPLPAGPGAGR